MLFALAVAFTPSARAAEAGILTAPPTAGSNVDSAARGAAHRHEATGLLAHAVGDARVAPRGAPGRGGLAQRAGAQPLAATPRLRGLGDGSPRSCTADAIMLEGGTSTEGNVMICHDDRFGPVCDDYWTEVDHAAGVACRQLGYPTGFATILSHFGQPSSAQYWLDDVQCDGTEASLGECAHRGWGNHNCDADEAAGVICLTALTGLSATGGNGRVSLAWDRPPWDAGITRHEYRYKTTGDYLSAWTPIPNSAAGETNEAKYTVTGLAGGTRHTFQVRVVGGGNASGPGEATATPAANSAPRITTSSPLQVAENTTTVTTLAATDGDDDDITWTKAGGADAARFEVTSGDELSFTAAPSYEAPADAASTAPPNDAANNEYVVTVRASDGSASTDLTLVVEVTDVSEQPAQPGRPTVSPTAGSTTSLDVSWTAPDRNGGPDIVGYRLQYRETGGRDWTDWTHDGTGTSAAITGLTPGAGYRARVRALNGETPSNWSAASDAVSTNSPPNSAPAITTSSPLQVAENTVTVTTLAATDDDDDDITWTKEGGADAAQFEVTSGDELSFTAAPSYEDPADVTSANPANDAGNNEYLVTVRASDGSASTDLTLVVEVTDVDEQPAKPDKPAVSPTAGSTTSLDVSWTAPDPNGGPDIIGYELQYQEAGDGEWTDWTDDGTGTSTAITGLTPGTEYQARVRALNGETPSDWSDASDAVSTNTPSTPTPTNSAPRFSGAALTRSVPENSPAGADVGEPVTATDSDTGDTLSYSLEGEDASSFSIVSSSGQIRTAAEVDYDHEAARNAYSVTVRASDGAASDTVAVTVDVTDVDEQPAKPDRPAVSPTAGSSTSLDVSWTAPDLDGGPDIIGYELQYREAEDGPWNDWTHDGTGTSTAVTGLTASTEYQARVRALNGETPSDWSDASGAVSPDSPANSAPTFPPGPLTRGVAENSPAGAAVGDPVTATDTDTGDTLSYNLEGEDASSFDIGAETGQITTRAGVSYDHEASPSYSVTVKADDGNGGAASVAVAIDVTDVDEQPARPDRPAVSPTADSTTGLDVSWTAPDLDGGPDIVGYEVQYRPSTVTTWTDWPHGGAATSTSITGLNASTEYQVRVRALNGETPSDWSEPAIAVTASPVPALGRLGLVVAALLLGGLRAGLHRRRRSALAGHPGGSVSTS